MKSYDSRCYDLAEIFLADTQFAGNEALIAELASEIQETIEDFLNGLEEEAKEEEET